MADRSVVVRLRAEIAGYRAAMSQAATATRNAARDMSREMTTSAQANQQAWNQAGGALTAFGAVTVGALGLAVKAAIDWETAWTGVLKTVDGTPAQLARVEDGLRGLARELPISHTELAGVAEAAGQLGIATDDVVSFTKVMVDLGQTTNLTAGDAATALARISNIMGTSADDVSRMGATIVELGNNSATTEREILEMATRLAAAGKQAGLSESDLFAFASTLTSVGVNAEAGGTAFSKVFVSIADAVRDGGDNLETFASVAGVSTAEFKRAFEEDAATGIAMFVNGMGDMSNAGEGTTKIFKDLKLNNSLLKNAVLASGSATGLLTSQLDMANSAWEANTALLAEAEKRYSTTESQINSAKGSIQDAAITMGETFLPVIADVAGGVSKAADAFGALPGPVQAMIGVTTLLVGGTALLAGGFLLLLPRIVATRAAFAVLSTSMPRITSAFRGVGTGLAAVAGQAAGIAILAAGFGLLVDKVMTAGEAAPKANALAQSIRAVATSGDMGDLDAQFDNFGKILGVNTGQVNDLAGAFDMMLKPSNTDKLTSLVSGFPGLNTYMEKTEERVKTLDAALAGMVEAGDVETVAAFQAQLMEMGYSAEDINKLLPTTIDALVGVDEAQKAAAESTVSVATGFGEVQEMSKEAAEALEEWRQKVMETSNAFVNPAGAYQAAIDASIAWAQSQADATESAEDSWENFYDGQSVSMADFLAQQQSQLDAQVNYNANMVKLAQSVSGEYLTYLQGLGTEGAPLIAALANALPEELAASDAMYQQGLANGQEYVDAVQAASDGRPVTVTISADGTIAYTVAEETVSEVSALQPKPWALGVDETPAIDTAANSTIPVLSGMTVEPWDLSARPENALSTGRQTSASIGGMTPSPWAVDAKTDPAIASANRAQNEINAKKSKITVDAVPSANFHSAVSSMAAQISNTWASISVSAAGGATQAARRATGGSVFGAGTETSDSIPALLSNNEHVWTAKEVRGAGGHGAVERLRAQAATGTLPAFAAGGAVTNLRNRAEALRREEQAELAHAEWLKRVYGDTEGADAATDRARGVADRAQAAERALSDEQARLARLEQSRQQLTRSTRRGEVTTQATSGLSGAYSVVNDLWDGAKNEDYSQKQRGALWSAAAKAEPAMKRLYAQADKVDKALESARDRAKELGSISDGVASRLSGEFSLEGSTKQNTNSRGDIWYTTGSIGANAKATAARVKGFAEKLSRLQKMGLSGGVLQELAQMGSVEGSIAADALLAGGKAEISTTNKAFSDLAKWSGQAGQYVTEGFYKGGLEAANGIVKGLESQQGAIEEQILKIAKAMEKALKDALGIRSPSKKTFVIGGQTGDGIIGGMKSKRRAIEDEATAMGLAAIPGVPSGASSASLAAASSRYAPTVNVNAPAPSLDGLAVSGQFSVGPDGLLTLVDGRIRQAESATATSVSRRY